MASITLTIPDALLPRVVSALCQYGAVPQTNANAKAVVVDWVKATVYAIEAQAAEAARPAAPLIDVSGLVT